MERKAIEGSERQVFDGDAYQEFYAFLQAESSLTERHLRMASCLVEMLNHNKDVAAHRGAIPGAGRGPRSQVMIDSSAVTDGDLARTEANHHHPSANNLCWRPPPSTDNHFRPTTFAAKWFLSIFGQLGAGPVSPPCRN